MRVHNRWDSCVVDVTVPRLEVLSSGNALLLSLVSEHRAECRIANAGDTLHARAELVVNNDAAPVVELDANLIKSQAGGVWSATYGDQDDVRVELRIIVSKEASIVKEKAYGLLAAALSTLNLNLDLVRAGICRENLGTELELDTLFLQQFLKLLAIMCARLATRN